MPAWRICRSYFVEKLWIYLLRFRDEMKIIVSVGRKGLGQIHAWLPFNWGKGRVLRNAVLPDAIDHPSGGRPSGEREQIIKSPVPCRPCPAPSRS